MAKCVEIEIEKLQAGGNGQKRKVIRRFVTLMEVMIVMVLIALVLGALAYNYQGTLEKGKIFKAERSKEMIQNILNLELARDPNIKNSLSSEWPKFIQQSPMVSNPNDLLKDPWGNEYTVEVDNQGNVKVTSPGLRSRGLEKNGS